MAKKEESFKASEIGIPSQNIELDPRSVTTANGMPRNYIPTGDKTEVRGTNSCLLYTSPSPRDGLLSRMPSSA